VDVGPVRVPASSPLVTYICVDAMIFCVLCFSNMNGAIRVNYFDSALVRLFAVKAFWVFWRVFAPLVIFKVPAAEFWVTFLIAELVSGYYLAFNFQVQYTRGVGCTGRQLVLKMFPPAVSSRCHTFPR
jgi:hypothetical protein